MKKTINFIILCLLVANNIFSQDAGITNPVENLIIHGNNRDTYFLNGEIDDMVVDGWSNTGNVSSIKVYYKSVSSSSYSFKTVSDPNSGSWSREIRVLGGEYQIYLNVRCNYVGCAQNGTNTPIRTFTYVRPFEAGDMYIAPTNDEHITIKRYRDYGITGLNTGFYFRTLRNTQPNAATATVISTFNQDEYFL